MPPPGVLLGQPSMLNNNKQSGNRVPLPGMLPGQPSLLISGKQPGEGLAPSELGSKPCTLRMRWRGWWYTHWVPCHIGAHIAMHSTLSTRKSAPLCVAVVARCLGWAMLSLPLHLSHSEIFSPVCPVSTSLCHLPLRISSRTFVHTTLHCRWPQQAYTSIPRNKGSTWLPSKGLCIICWGLCSPPNMMCHNSPSCTSLIPWMHKSQHALQLWVLRALLCISQLWWGYNRCCMITTHLCNVSNKSWTCPHMTCLNGKLSLGSTAMLTSDVTMLLLPPKWLGCCQVRFFSNVYYCVICLLPSYIWCNVPHSLT